VQAASSSSPSPQEDQPLRLLLVRSRRGELPLLASMIAQTMAPVEIDEIVGFANAIWQVGNKQYDTVLLDVDLRDPEAITYYREQIAKVADVPVLNVREQAASETATAEHEAPRQERQSEPTGLQNKGSRRRLRVPWQRRPRRQPQPAAETNVASVG